MKRRHDLMDTSVYGVLSTSPSGEDAADDAEVLERIESK
jgi:hypothetical protein